MTGSGQELKLTRSNLVKGGLGWLFESTFLAWFHPDELDGCLKAMEWREYSRGEKLTQLGTPSDGVDLLISGQVVVMSTGDRVPVPIAPVGAGHIIGERSLATGEPHMADVVATCRVHSLFLPGDAFAGFYQASSHFRGYIDGLVAIRDRWALLAALLSQNPFLRSLGMDDVERLLQASRLVIAQRGATILSAGERGTEVLVVVKGRVGIYAPDDGNGRQQVATAEPGDLVGHAAIMLELPRTADLVAALDCELLWIEATAFMDIVTRNPLVQRQLLQYLATTDLHASPSGPGRRQRMVTFVCAADGGLGTTTLAYGIAACLRSMGAPILVDAEGAESAHRLGLPVRDSELAGLKIREMDVPRAWGFRVLWPATSPQLSRLVSALRHDESLAPLASPVVVTGRPASKATDAAVKEAESLVFVRHAGDSLVDIPVQRGQLRYQAIRIQPEVPLPLMTSRKAARVTDDARSARNFWMTGDLSSISTIATPLGRACRRLTRLLRGRAVGVALGGGGALGFAHVGLLRVLERAKFEIDYVAGVSFGSLVGAIYVGGGLPALEDLIRKRYLLTGAAAAAMISTRAFSSFVRSITGRQYLGATEVPFYPVGLDLSTGREFVLAEGDLGMAVRSSSCLPGVFPALRVGVSRLVDGGMVNNVPASVIWEAGGDFIIGSNIIPPKPEGSRRPLGTVAAGRFLLGGLARLDDTVRSLYMFMSQTGRDRSLMADFIFDLAIEGYNIYDFPKGAEIADAGQRQAEQMLPQILKAHEEDGSIRF